MKIKVIILVVILLSAFTLMTAQNTTALNNKRTQVRQNINKVQSQLSQAKKTQKQARATTEQARSQVRSTRTELTAAKERLTLAEKELRIAQEEYDKANAQYSIVKDQVGSRLYATYVRGEQGYLDFIFTSSDFSNLMEKLQLASYIKAQDEILLTDLNNTRKILEEKRVSLEQKKSAVQLWKNQVAIKHSANVQTQYAAESKLKDANKTVELTEKKYYELIQVSNDIESELRRNASSGSVYNGNGLISGWPNRGRISSEYGYRVHPISKSRRLHTGMDIAAPSGTAISATGKGKVIYAGWRGGYGNTVMIDHGRNKSGQNIVTLYGHMSSISAKSGQVVSKGQQIGKVGSTGNSTGPHCHYEVRLNGATVNPRPYM